MGDEVWTKEGVSKNPSVYSLNKNAAKPSVQRSVLYSRKGCNWMVTILGMVTVLSFWDQCSHAPPHFVALWICRLFPCRIVEYVSYPSVEYVPCPSVEYIPCPSVYFVPCQRVEYVSCPSTKYGNCPSLEYNPCPSANYVPVPVLSIRYSHCPSLQYNPCPSVNYVPCPSAPYLPCKMWLSCVCWKSD